MQDRFQEKEYNTKSLNIGLWKSIIKLLVKQKKLLLYMLFTIAVVAIGDIAFPILSRYAIDTFIINQELQNLNGFIIVYFLIIIVQSYHIYQFIYQAGRVEMEFAYDIRRRLFNKLQEFSFSFFDVTPTGWLMTRLTSDVQKLSEIVSWGFLDLTWSFVVMIAVTITMFIFNVKLALLVLLVVPLIAFISFWFQVKLLKSYREVRKVNSKITTGFTEGIDGAQTTKTLGLEDKHYAEFKELTSSMREKSVRAASLSALFLPTVMFLSSVATALVLSWGGYDLMIGNLDLGTLIMFTQFARMFYDPLRNVASILSELQMAQAAGERVLSLFNEEVQVIDSKSVIEKYGTVLQQKRENYPIMKGEIEFKNVSFYYNQEEKVLDDFNLKVNPGETIALVGETGSGKSTIVNLICRFYEPVKGVISIDGQDYRNYSIGWLHHNLGYVLQSPNLFSGSIKDNIRYGKLDASDEEIIEAAKKVNAHEFIMRLEKGYDSEVGEGGSKLSTGEKQLLSFARAIIRKPSLFILDEATSSIDTETEALIQEAIAEVLKGRTSFVVAHRLSTIISADRILVIKSGKIVESGTHQELLSLKGYYYRLYTQQFQNEKASELLGKK